MTIHLIAAIGTISVQVTFPLFRNTAASGIASEFIRFACVIFHAAICFVGSIATIIFAIAFPLFADTTTIGALEFGVLACWILAILFVRIVGAIVVVVAYEIFGDAFIDGTACEHMWRAWWFICGATFFIGSIATIVFAVAFESLEI